jgi:hypothetical protein
MFTNWLQKNKSPTMARTPRGGARMPITSSQARTPTAGAPNVSAAEPFSSRDSH